MKKETKSFLIKAGILLFPLCVLLIVYVWQDPFKVLRKYDTYLYSNEPPHVELNQGHVAVETFLKNYPKYKYDSIIFGNSRSKFYPVADWKKHITATECYHFDAANESLYGVAKKFEFLKKQNVKLKNVLFIVDSYLLAQANDTERHLGVQPPALTGESRFSFQVKFLKTYLNIKFLVPYFDFKIRGKYRPYMDDVFSDILFLYDPVTDEVTYQVFEEMIEKNKDHYYRPRKKLFTHRDGVEREARAVIAGKQIEQLKFIKERLDADGAEYRLVVSPLYEQKKLNAEDLALLNDIFGKDHVFDFSGVNEYTSTIDNYYEASHYRPHVSRAILAEIYR